MKRSSHWRFMSSSASRAIALRRKIDDDLGLLPVEQFEQQIKLVRHVARVIDVTFALRHAEGERLRPQGIAPDADDFLRLRVIEQIEGGMDAEAAAAAQNRIGLSGHKVRVPRSDLFDDGPVVVAGIARFLEKFDPSLRIIIKIGGQHPAFENLLLLGRVVAVDLHEGTPSGGALDLLHYLDRPWAGEIVHGIETEHAIEAVVGERQFLRSAEVQPAYDLLLGVHERIS